MEAFGKALYGICLVMMPWMVTAEESEAESSVENNIHEMDKDHDGMVTVHEIRAQIEAKHGKSYEIDALDRLEETANGASCTSPFAKPLY